MLTPVRQCQLFHPDLFAMHASEVIVLVLLAHTNTQLFTVCSHVYVHTQYVCLNQHVGYVLVHLGTGCSSISSIYPYHSMLYGPCTLRTLDMEWSVEMIIHCE